MYDVLSEVFFSTFYHRKMKNVQANDNFHFVRNMLIKNDPKQCQFHELKVLSLLAVRISRKKWDTVNSC